MLFVCYPKCTTCQRAKKFLDDRGVSYTERHIKENNPTAEELRGWWQASGLPLKKFFNTSGLLYKSLELKDKLPTMTEEDQLALLATDGMLVKRPILVADDFVLVGFREVSGPRGCKKRPASGKGNGSDRLEGFHWGSSSLSLLKNIPLLTLGSRVLFPLSVPDRTKRGQMERVEGLPLIESPPTRS